WGLEGMALLASADQTNAKRSATGRHDPRGLDQVQKALLFDEAANREHHRAVRGAVRGAIRPEAVEVDAVVDAVDPVGPRLAGQVHQMVRVVLGTGHHESRRAELGFEQLGWGGVD